MPTPKQIELKKRSNQLLLTYGEQRFALDAEYLRVYSPSAEVRGHGPEQAVLQTGKQFVRIDTVEGVGHYALRIFFSDGHNSGLYTWDYLYELSENREVLWRKYLDQLQQAGKSRDPNEQAVQFVPLTNHPSNDS